MSFNIQHIIDKGWECYANDYIGIVENTMGIYHLNLIKQLVRNYQGDYVKNRIVLLARSNPGLHLYIIREYTGNKKLCFILHDFGRNIRCISHDYANIESNIEYKTPKKWDKYHEQLFNTK